MKKKIPKIAIWIGNIINRKLWIHILMIIENEMIIDIAQKLNI